MKILRVIQSVEEVKVILNSQQKPNNCSRLKIEAKFISHLWGAINCESIPCLELKKIIYLFHLKKGRHLRQILQEMFENELAAIELYNSWNELQNDKFYYQRPLAEKVKTEEDLNSTWSLEKKFEKIKSFDRSKIRLKSKSR